MSEILKSLKAWNSFANGGPRPEGPPVRCEEAANEVESLEQRIRELELINADLYEALELLHGRYVACIGNEGPEAVAARLALAKARGEE